MFYNLLQFGDAWLEELGTYSLLQVLYQIEFRAFAAAITAFLIVLLAGKPVIRWLIKQKIGDSPEFDHADLNALMGSKRATPTMGGILIVGAILISVLLLADLQNKYVHLCLVVTVWLALVGGADDWLKLTTERRSPGSRHGLYWWEKLLFQFGIGLVAAIFLWRLTGDNEAARALVIPLQRTYLPGMEGLVLQSGVIVLGFWSFTLIVMFLIAGTSNAVNITDGMDGLASGVSAIAALGVMLLAYIAGSSERSLYMLFPFVDGSAELMVIAGAMVGACLGFLWFNCAPATVFMGDTGSLPLGGLLATMACAVRQEVLLILMGGVFFMELGSVILQVGWFKITRRFTGEARRIFRCAPLHHHFHLAGWQESQVVSRFWILSIIFVVGSMVLLKLR